MADNGTIEIEGLAEGVKKLKQMMSDDPGFRKRVNNVIRRVLMEARREVMQKAGDEMDNDPRHAYKAVRSAVYRRILGGQLNILQKRRAGTPTSYTPPRKGLPSRGGNRWGRSERTKQLEGYEGTDRGFVLRFINAGTADRAIHSFTDRNGTRHDLRSGSVSILRTKGLGGNRGNVRAHNWFGNASHVALERAAGNMDEFIDRVINEEFM